MANELKVNDRVTLEPTMVDAGATYVYYGYEAPNADAGALTQCSVKRYTIATGKTEWAGGDPLKFSYAWANRATLTYKTRIK